MLVKGEIRCEHLFNTASRKKTGEGSRSDVCAVCSEIMVGLFDQLEFESNHFDLRRAHNVMIHFSPNDH